MAIEVSLVTDELSADPRTAFELGSEWGIRHYELRGFYAERAPMISRHQRHRLHQMVGEFGASITALSPGLFKIPYPAAEPAESNLGWMDRGFFAQWEAQANALTEHMENFCCPPRSRWRRRSAPPSSSPSASIAPALPAVRHPPG